MTLLSDVEAALTDEFTRAAHVWFNVPSANFVDVEKALDELVNLERAEKTKELLGYYYLYRRARKQDAA